jgi:hypothetical protein
LKLTSQWSKEETHAKSRHNYHRSPPRRAGVEPKALDRLWDLLTDEQRQRALVTLSGIVARQIGTALDEREVADEQS